LKKTVLILLSVTLLSFAGLSALAESVSYKGYFAIYSISDETYVRSSTGNPGEAGSNEYVAFRFELKNTSSSRTVWKNVTCYVDGTEMGRWGDMTVNGYETQYLHVYRVNMVKLSAGSHRFEVYIGGKRVVSDSFTTIRNWSSLMKYPTARQISAAAYSGRSPYIVFYPQFSGTTVLSEYSIDFQIDDMEKGTYFSTMDANMDISSLTSRYSSVTNDYNDPGGFYCGFQQWENGKTAVIMSVWDIFCKDRYGNKTTICATQLYPTYKRGVSKTSAEGSFQQFLIEYKWETRHPYRMLMQRSFSDTTGNTVLTMWVCDLKTMEWTELVSWDLGYNSSGIKTCELAGFMENYDTQYCGNVRNVSFSNIRGRDSATGRIYAAKTVRFTVNNSITASDYTGSYNFGADDSSFWIITSGVNGLCRNPSSGTGYTVKNSSTDSPY